MEPRRIVDLFSGIPLAPSLRKRETASQHNDFAFIVSKVLPVELASSALLSQR